MVGASGQKCLCSGCGKGRDGGSGAGRDRGSEDGVDGMRCGVGASSEGDVGGGGGGGGGGACVLLLSLSL